MTIAIGVDIVEIERISEAFARQGDKLVTRILTAPEKERFDSIANQQTKIAFLAKRWSAKEAISKALGTGIAKGIGWQEMEILNDDLGAPSVSLKGAAQERLIKVTGSKVLISLSDERHYAVAYCTIV